MQPMGPYDDYDDLPTRFKPHHTAAQRAVMVFNIIVIVGCLVGAGVLLYGKNVVDNTLATEHVEVVTTLGTVAPTTSAPGTTVPVESTIPVTFPPADPQALNFLVAGSDANSCVDPGSPWSNAADPGRDTQGRSDSIMLIRMDPTTRQAAVLSFPRDLWVKINGANGRINTAYVENDYTLLAQTIYDNFGIVVDHYLQVDFCAFKTIVDAVGGVAVPFKTPVIDLHVGINIPVAGCHVFSGDEALAYVRSRHLKWIDAQGNTNEDRAADLGRVSRQQDFLRRVLQAALKKGIFDPAVATALIESLQTYIVRDAGMTIDDILSFAGVMRDIDPVGIRTYQVESYGKVVGGVAVQIPKLKTDNMQAILAIFQGTAPLAGAPGVVSTPTTIAGAPATTAPTGTTVVVEPDEDVQGDIVPDETVQC